MHQGYIEFMHYQRSHLLAVPVKRKHCTKGTLLRTGVPLTSSCLCVMLCAAPLLLCKLQIFVRMGQMLLLSSLMSVLCSMAFMPALLSLWGPTKVTLTFKRRALFLVGLVLLVAVVLAIFWQVQVPLRWPNGELIFYAAEADEYDANLNLYGP